LPVLLLSGIVPAFGDDTLPTVLTAGDLSMKLQSVRTGVRLVSLDDLQSHRQLLAEKVLPLFELTVRVSTSCPISTADCGTRTTEEGTPHLRRIAEVVSCYLAFC
jgi:hypothetical protein